MNPLAKAGDPRGRFFDNQSEGVVYILPEEGGDPVRLESGERFDSGVDAFSDLALAARDPRALVFKVVDGISVTYGRDSRIRLQGGSFVERVGQSLEGGFKDIEWLRTQKYFLDFYQAALRDSETF